MQQSTRKRKGISVSLTPNKSNTQASSQVQRQSVLPIIQVQKPLTILPIDYSNRISNQSKFANHAGIIIPSPLPSALSLSCYSYRSVQPKKAQQNVQSQSLYNSLQSQSANKMQAYSYSQTNEYQGGISSNAYNYNCIQNTANQMVVQPSRYQGNSNPTPIVTYPVASKINQEIKKSQEFDIELSKLQKQLNTRRQHLQNLEREISRPSTLRNSNYQRDSPIINNKQNLSTTLIDPLPSKGQINVQQNKIKIEKQTKKIESFSIQKDYFSQIKYKSLNQDLNDNAKNIKQQKYLNQVNNMQVGSRNMQRQQDIKNIQQKILKLEWAQQKLSRIITLCKFQQ